MLNTFLSKTITFIYNKKISTFLKNYFQNIFILYFVVIFFLWNVDYILFEAKYLTAVVFLISFFAYTKNLNLLKSKKIISILLFLVIHFFLVIIQSKGNFFKDNFLHYSFTLISILTAILLYDQLKKNFITIIKYFMVIFNSFFIIFVSFYLFENGSFNVDCYNGIFSETEFIFNENSHFGLISSAVILYNTNIILENQNSKHKQFFLVNTLIFTLISFLSISTSFLFIILSLSIIFLIINNSIKKKLFYFGMIVVSILFLNFKEQCNYRSIENIKQAAKTIDINFSDTEKKEEVDYQIKVPDQALSYKVFLKSIQIGVFTLPKNVFGVGINNYDQLFEKYREKQDIFGGEENFLNIEDASNNFSKIIGEFGIFGLILYFFLLIRLIKIDPSNSFQIFLITATLSQSLRGVGYFTAAFVILITSLYLNIYEKKSKKK